MQVTYVRLFFCGENTGTCIYQWELRLTRNFQHKINDLFLGFEFICAYIDNLLILTKEDFIDHIQRLELILNKPKEKITKFNIENYFFRQTEIEYLGF